MAPPVRVLLVCPQPVDVPWRELSVAAMQALASVFGSLRPTVEAASLTPATAAALEERVKGNAFDLLHLLTFGKSRAAARHGTLAFEGSDRRLRDVNAQNIARICARLPAASLTVLHAVPGADADLTVASDALAAQGASVLLVPGSMPAAQSERFFRDFYGGLAQALPVAEAFDRAAGNPAGLPTRPPGASAPQLHGSRERVAAPVSHAAPASSRPVEAPEVYAAAPPPPAPDQRERAAALELERKRAACAFDVFLCHNVADKPAVMTIGRRLMERGILPWLDQWELRPGVPWQRLLEQQISSIAAAAVFVGPSGIGPWQRQELEGFLGEFVRRGCPVIPVMLPGSAGEPVLPIFLRGMTWVDFRAAEPDPLEQLIWGITGEKPAFR